MRFFSNDAKETNDDETDRTDEAPAAVPQQRIGSPWSDARVDNDAQVDSDVRVGSDAQPVDGDAQPVDGEPGRPETVDGEIVDGEPVNAGRADREPVDGEPVTGEGGHNAHDLGGPESSTDEHDDLDLPLEEQPTNTESTESDLSTTGRTDTDLSSTDLSSTDLSNTGPTDADTDNDGDPALRDEGDFDEPHAVDPATHEKLDGDAVTGTEFDAPVAVTPVDSDSDSTTYASSAAGDGTVADGAVSSDSVADDSVADDSVADDTLADDTVADDTVVVAAVPAAAAAGTGSATGANTTEPVAQPSAVADEPAKPGAVEEKSVETLFGADAAQTFQERWRDVQLRFVDSPKDATAEAAGLVDEAVDALTTSLKSQKDNLLSDSEDTEKLRIELRGYRDMLNKVLSL